jgi:hypothetical protein
MAQPTRSKSASADVSRQHARPAERIERALRTADAFIERVRRLDPRSTEIRPLFRDALKDAVDLATAVGPRKAHQTIAKLVAADPAPTTVTPESPHERQLRRAKELRAEFLVSYPSVTAAELADSTGSNARNRAQRAYAWERTGRIFSISDGTRKLYPAFQFTGAEPEPNPVIATVLAALRPSRSPWELAMWFASPHPSLPKGSRPADLLERDSDAVIRAAEIDAEEIAY